MQVHRTKSRLLKKIESIVSSNFPRLGINKKEEFVRLLYEISKRESRLPENIIQDITPGDFNKVKKQLLKKRFPYAYLHNELSKPYLPKLRLDPSSRLIHRRTRFYPKKIFIERAARRSHLANRFIEFFPDAGLSEMHSLKDYLKKNRSFTIKDYNNRSSTVFVTKENHDFFKRCPCTKNALRCGYNIFNLSFGCIFECTYCYLQEYTNGPGLIFPANIDRFFQAFASFKRPGMRIGTGEFSDSLMLDHITEYSIPIVDFFKRHASVTFEFKTKSKNIDNLLKMNHAGNIVISWSLNPQAVIDANEFLAPSLNERISAARRCSEAGYKLGFHFDPVVYFKGWEKDYEKIIALLFDAIRPRDIAWISIGTLRFNPKVKQVIEQRFPENKILDEELVPGFDRKLRYPYSIRRKIYASMLRILSSHSKKLAIYLCMEDSFMWRDLFPSSKTKPFSSLR